MSTRLRKTRGLAIFVLLALAMPFLVGAAADGTATLLATGHTGLTFSALNGQVRFVPEGLTEVRINDVIVAVGGVAVDGDPEKIKAALLETRPGPVTFRFRRGARDWDVTIDAASYPTSIRVVLWTRIISGTLLFLIGCAAFVLRSGSLVSWLFLFFSTSLSLHLLGFMALLRHPQEAIVVESIGVYLAGASGLHLFTVFPQSLFRHRLWAGVIYLPALVGTVVLLVFYRDPAAYSVTARTIQLGHILAPLAAFAAGGLVLYQHHWARLSRDTIAQSRSRSLLVAVGVGLALPALLGVVPWIQHDFDWALSSFLVVVFVAMTAYAMARHNALDVDRFTAAVLGYGVTTLLLLVGFATLITGIPAFFGTAGLLESPFMSALLTAAFFLIFNPLYRRIRRKADRWFLRERVEEDTALRLLRQLADSVRTAELGEAFRVGLETAMVLHGERAELWTRTPEGAFVRISGLGPSSLAPTPPIGEESPLVAALAEHSGGVEGLVDRALEEAAQEELWSRDLTMASPVFSDDRLTGFVALARKSNGTAYTRRERAFLDTVASHLGIAMERDWERTERLGPYRIVKRIGTGGMAEVYLAEKHGPGGFELQVAMKRILPHLNQDPACVAQFLDEARIAAHLQHPNIVRIFDIEEYEGNYFLAMEYMDGPSLDALIQAAEKRSTSLPLPVVAALAVALLNALSCAHDLKDRRGRSLGLVHRDVKPGNILLNRQGEIKLTDFGIARAEFRLYQTQPGLARGTPAYMPPEQHGDGEIRPQTDLFAAGAVLYEAATGWRAISMGSRGDRTTPVTTLQSRLPVALDAFFDQALAAAPEDRFASAEAMREAFLGAIAPVDPASAEEVSAAIESLVSQ